MVAALLYTRKIDQLLDLYLTTLVSTPMADVITAFGFATSKLTAWQKTKA
jgi:hypothetical protein